MRRHLLKSFDLGRGSSLNDLATDYASSGNVGGVTLIYNTMKYVGQTASPLFLGIVLGFFSRSVVFLVSGSLGLAFAITYLFLSVFRE